MIQPAGKIHSACRIQPTGRIYATSRLQPDEKINPTGRMQLAGRNYLGGMIQTHIITASW